VDVSEPFGEEGAFNVVVGEGEGFGAGAGGFLPAPGLAAGNRRGRR
jgi:hypothetical protein